jgi:hypothetical protein
LIGGVESGKTKAVFFFSQAAENPRESRRTKKVSSTEQTYLQILNNARYP